VKRLIPVLIIILIAGSLPLIAQSVPPSIRNNHYFLESVRFANLANLAFDEGDYLASYRFSAESIYFANLSDEYVLLQLKIREADDAIAAARRRLDFAESVNAQSRYPGEYDSAQSFFTQARNHRAGERWDDAIYAANQVLISLAGISEPPAGIALLMLPAEYTVRPWGVSADCFWNIAGRPWVYNDPWKWRILYEANRDRIPEPDNPNLIHPGMIMVIPSINGEQRQGMWNINTEYPTFR